MSFLDIHAHFADEGYEFPAGWEKIRAAGVGTVVLAGDNLAHSKMHRDFCKEHAGAYFCAGVHPSEINGFGQAELEELKTLACEEKCIAIGEIGLDYHYPEPEREQQKEAFLLQMRLADKCSLPLEIHSRDAAEDTLELLTAHRDLLKHGFLLHCYSYGAEMMGSFLKLGAYFSFGGTTCFKNARRVVESVTACPLDRILSETDSPYLSPFRGEKNTPANIPVIVRRIAEIKGVDTETMKAQIEKNAHALFPKL